MEKEPLFNSMQRFGEFEVEGLSIAIAGFSKGPHLWIYRTTPKPLCIGAIAYIDSPEPGVALNELYTQAFKEECATKSLTILRENKVWTA